MRSGVCGQRGSGGKALRVAAEAMPQRSAPSSFARRFTAAESTGDASGVPRLSLRDMRYSIRYRMDDLALPASRDELAALQAERKARALERARRAPFFRNRLNGVRHWRDIPILDKETLRGLSPAEFYRDFCTGPREDWRELWRSGGTTGKPLFYPRTAEDLHWAMIGFRRVYHCIGAGVGDVAHLSMPLGIHTAGQMMARAGEAEGIAMAWVGAGAAAPSELQLDLLALFRPTLWIGMSSYG